MIDIHIKDGSGSKNYAKISPQGEIFTRQLKFGIAKFQAMDTTDTAFNFFPPRPGERFVITGVLVNTNKDIGVDGAIVDLYEASSATSTTIDKSLARTNLLKNDTVPLPGIFLGVTEGKFINGKTDDTIVNMTVGGYYVDV